LALPVLQAYHAYYKRFEKTYHLLLQLESIVFKDKSIPHVAALVEAMFMAELEDLLLTAGHDLEVIQQPLRLDVAQGEEQYTLLRGDTQILKPGDMFIADAAGVTSSILYGPDRRTQINPETRQVLFTTYGPPGIGSQAVLDHLRNIEGKVRLFAPGTQVEILNVYET
jgi:DNA/RNA-binding domain of Phe-tRNA-synthetase-like protein